MSSALKTDANYPTHGPKGKVVEDALQSTITLSLCKPRTIAMMKIINEMDLLFFM